MGPFEQGKSIYCNGSPYDLTGGSAYNPPPPPVSRANLLLQSRYKIKLQNGNYLALQES